MTGYGVLALQGDYAAHLAALGRLGVPARAVRRAAEVPGLAGLILPGGESTALLKLMDGEPWFETLAAFHESGGTLLGTCAGAILLAREVWPSQPSLALLDASVERNAYGRQIDSFEQELRALGPGAPARGVFIRAPRFRALGRGVEVLASLSDEPVLVRQGSVLAATFHPELTEDLALHRLFVESAKQRAGDLPAAMRS